MKGKILFFGPYPPPITGQSISFKTFVDEVDPKIKIIINTTKYGSHKLTNTIFTIFKTIFVFSTIKISTVYFTCSRSKVGFIKEFPLLIICRIFKIKVVNHLHGNEFKHFYDNAGLIKPLIKYSYNGINTSIVLLEEMENQFIDFPSMELKVVHNCFGRDFEKISISKTKPAYGINILYLSNIIKSKGILEFLEAAESICSLRSDVKFTIAGKPMGDQFWSHIKIEKEFSKRYNYLKEAYPGQISYLGPVKGQQKIDEMIKTDVFILPTYYPAEAFPISILEAMRCGCAIITTNHNLLSSIVKPENGILIEKQSSSAIADAIIKLSEDKHSLHQMQEYNVEYARKHYSTDAYVTALKEIVIQH